METETKNTVTCNNCRWVHFQVSLEYAKNEVQRFNEYFATLPKKKQKDYYGGHGASLDTYLGCMVCGGSYKNFRDAVPGDVPMGCTINPILARNEEV